MLLGFNLLLWTTHVTQEHFHLFEEIRKTGYDGVELPIFEGDPEHFRKVGQVAKDAGLRITAVTVLPDEQTSAISPDPASRANALKRLHWALDCLSAAGGELLCGPFYQPLGVFTGEPATTEERAGIVEVHSQAADYAAKLNLKLAVEPLNRFECHALNTVEDTAAVVTKVARPNYGMLYDTFHQNIEEKDPVGVILPNIAQINHVHVSENDRGTPGKGHVPWDATFKAFKKGGYQGFYTIEAFGRALPALAAATRVWRDFFPSRDEVYRFGHDFLREAHAKA
ncbi:MAG TPA: sugar phosphate isomerase/epimerase [Geminicoccus sp.]|jgi:D-psicose/D-tagatose/L-ribulose 3-epimerase|uniref:sugar phosphate isomerase/epimerase family protein n=1 Tax=Geminicoccus sp. TaxID=2024832 RepID=UPI002E2ECBB1|nr:sugar phosphate isomerase/epimerase [Geminicoccus sp.]HEX2527857.1 sugar phosphate isomerase/epimerase [Geminicoccus sp.]